jgi:hypothetical protein
MIFRLWVMGGCALVFGEFDEGWRGGFREVKVVSEVVKEQLGALVYFTFKLEAVGVPRQATDSIVVLVIPSDAILFEGLGIKV